MAIIVGLSDTPLGGLVIDRAVEEATLRDLPLVLTASVGTPRNEQAMAAYGGRHDEVEAALERKARQLTERGLRCEIYLPPTPTELADALVDAAKEHDAELIVVGIRRRSPVGKLVLGSVTQDVLLAAECPVLGVKLPADVEDQH